MHEATSLRLRHIVVTGLFNIFNHEVSLNLGERVNFIHGLNGTGKTVLLGMVHSLLRQQFGNLIKIPFSTLLLEFNDESILELVSSCPDLNEDERYVLRLSRAHINGNRDFELAISRDDILDEIVAKIDYLRPHSPRGRSWIDERTGELLEATQVVDRYAHTDLQLQRRSEAGWIHDFLSRVRVHFIKEQRIVRLVPVSTRRFHYGDIQPFDLTTRAVDECSKDLRMQISKALVKYVRVSRTLDESFPQRFIAATGHLQGETLKEQMKRLDVRTIELMKSGILGEISRRPIPLESIDDLDQTKLRVLTMYVNDTNKKLEVLDDLASRLHWLLNIVNGKFRHKRIKFDAELGFFAVDDNNEELPLRSLSSGEQQTLILFYDLLFRVQSNAIVLIDEPEVSLHIGWQKSFLRDLLAIAKLSKFDMLVATHSPYLAGERFDLMVSLDEVN